MPADPKRAREFFLHAVGKLPTEDWEAYVGRACGGDLGLEAELRRLLSAHRQAGSFLEVPATLGPTAAFTSFPGEVADLLLRERPGTIIGPYTLIERLGEGGMGTVFKAEQSHPIRRRVALKVIKAGMDSRQVIARFEAERQALSMMDHVNIARVLDVGATGSGRPYFVMELIDGVPITTYCDDNRLTPRERLELFVPVCQAIQHAHQKGIIHRDIKPSNVMITVYEGKAVPKVIDFGVAKATEQRLTERTVFTQNGTLVGTLEYMSPEQADLSASGVDTRSDIFSLGVLLYELLTGSTPLNCQRMRAAAFGEALRMIKEEEPPRPSSRLSSSEGDLKSISQHRQMEPTKLTRLLRGELDWIVMKTLEKDRNRRYETANGLAADILCYLNDEPVLACPASPGYRLSSFARRHKQAFRAAALFVGLLMLGVCISTWQAVRATLAETAARVAQRRVVAERDRALHAEGTAQAQLLLTERAEGRATEARLAQVKAGHLGRRPGQRFDSLDAIARAAQLARERGLPREHVLELRNAAIAALALPDLRLTRRWPTRGDHLCYGFDGNLERYCYADARGLTSVRRVADDAGVASIPGSGPAAVPALSPDGKFVVVRSSGEIKVWSLGGPAPAREVLSVPPGRACSFDFSPDSRRCVVGNVDGSIDLHDLATGQPPRRLPAGRRPDGLSIHPMGRMVAVVTEALVELRDLDTGAVTLELQAGIKPEQVAWHPDGKTLAASYSDWKIRFFGVPEGKPTLVIEGIRNGGISLTFSHAGDLLATTGWDGLLRLWDTRSGRQLFRTASGMAGNPPRFRRDDRLLTGDVRDGMLGLWEVGGGGEYRTLLRNPASGQGDYLMQSLSADGRLLAVAMGDGVGFWELPSGKELAFVGVPGSRFVLFEASGSLVTTGTAGLLRWPVTAGQASPDPSTPRDGPETTNLRIGPPRKLATSGPVCHVASSRDGRVIAMSQWKGGSILRADRPGRPLAIGPHADARYVSVSPDGLRVATGSHNGPGIKIWDARTGALEKELAVGGSQVGFSPDGRWLATTPDGLQLWAVGSWERGPRINATKFAYSPDLRSPSGKLLAVETGYGAIQLLDPETLAEYARLEDPDQDRAFGLNFNADATQLIASNIDGGSVHAWDLREIREQLARIGLDWDLPPYPPPGPEVGRPLRVEVDAGGLDALIRAREQVLLADRQIHSQKWADAIEALAHCVELDPEDSRSQNNLSWILATCPDPSLRDPARALGSARRAAELAPSEGNSWNTLGVACYRSGDWNAAIVALEKSEGLLLGKDLGYNAFFLAMALRKSGKTEEALGRFDQAVRWTEANSPKDDELRRFRIEAAELLGVSTKKD